MAYGDSESYENYRAAFLDWVYCGKPRTGVTYDIMRRTRSQFKLALRYCKQHADMLRADAHATALMSKDFNRFWENINKCNNDKIKKYTPVLDGCSGENE